MGGSGHPSLRRRILPYYSLHLQNDDQEAQQEEEDDEEAEVQARLLAIFVLLNDFLQIIITLRQLRKGILSLPILGFQQFALGANKVFHVLGVPLQLIQRPANLQSNGLELLVIFLEFFEDRFLVVVEFFLIRLIYRPVPLLPISLKNVHDVGLGVVCRQSLRVRVAVAGRALLPVIHPRLVRLFLELLVEQVEILPEQIDVPRSLLELKLLQFALIFVLVGFEDRPQILQIRLANIKFRLHFLIKQDPLLALVALGRYVVQPLLQLFLDLLHLALQFLRDRVKQVLVLLVLLQILVGLASERQHHVLDLPLQSVNFYSRHLLK